MILGPSRRLRADGAASRGAGVPDTPVVPAGPSPGAGRLPGRGGTPPPRRERRAQGPENGDATEMIEVEGLTKRYGRATAVDGVSFRVEKGEILGFLGPNGAGKTTTMRILTCYLPPTDGTARVAGYDVFAQPLEVKKRVGYLPETPPLYPDMSVRDYLDFCARIKAVPPG